MTMNDLKNANPDQIKIYKDAWRPNGHPVEVDQTLDVKGKD